MAIYKETKFLNRNNNLATITKLGPSQGKAYMTICERTVKTSQSMNELTGRRTDGRS